MRSSVSTTIRQRNDSLYRLINTEIRKRVFVKVKVDRSLKKLIVMNLNEKSIEDRSNKEVISY